MTIQILTSWQAKRSGAAITITHAAGKVMGVAAIEARHDKVLAIHPDGRTFELALGLARKGARK